MPDTSRPVVATVESFLAAIHALPMQGEPKRFELWVPNSLTLSGQPAPNDLGMAVILDALLGKGFMPAGVEPGIGGRVCRYTR